MKYIERTPLSDIERIEIYQNTKKLSLKKIVQEKEPDIALTAVFYKPKTWKPVCPVKADGKVLYSDPEYNYWAIAWDKGSDARPELIPPGGASDAKNYAANCILMTEGVPHEKLYYGEDVGGRRGRVAAALSDWGEWITVGFPDGADGMTPEELRDFMATVPGCKFAVMMDGGRKVNLYIRHAGVTLEGKDPSQTLILIWLKKEEDKPVEKKGKIVCLDAGHDAGNTANASPDGTYFEHEFALDMAKRIRGYLEAVGVTVVETRQGGEAVTLAERCSIANKAGADLFVSLHSNAAATTGWSSAKGWMCYVYGLSGERYKAAKAILARVDGVAKAIRSVPIIENDELYVLKHTKAPAVLIEHGFHTNKDDVAMMKDSAYRDRLAAAQTLGIMDYFGITAPEKPTEIEQAVAWITETEIMLGDDSGDLMLDQPVTRKQFAVMLYRYHQMNGQK